MNYLLGIGADLNSQLCGQLGFCGYLWPRHDARGGIVRRQNGITKIDEGPEQAIRIDLFEIFLGIQGAAN